jgi:hypothetical protein
MLMLLLQVMIKLDNPVYINPHWAHAVGYGPFSLCVIHKKGMCPSSGDINTLMTMISYLFVIIEFFHFIFLCYVLIEIN